MCANSEDFGETAQMHSLAWAFAVRLCDKYHNLMSWLIYSLFRGSQNISLAIVSTKFVGKFAENFFEKIELCIHKSISKYMSFYGKNSKKGETSKFLIFYPKCLKSTSKLRKEFKCLSEAKTSESSQQFCQNLQFMIIDYLPCPYKIPL